jgi:F-type H+-transporting ATPase subunit a
VYNYFKILLLAFTLLIFRTSVFAQNHEEAAVTNGSTLVATPAAETKEAGTEEHKSEKFNPGELILGHIADAHEWHFFSIGEKHITLPLPCIVNGPNGLEIFSSSKFHHEGVDNSYATAEGQIIEGKMLSNGYLMNHHGKIYRPDGASFFDFSITKNVASMMLSVLLLIIIFTQIAKKYSANNNQAPSGLQNALEPFVLFVRDDIAKAALGHKAAKFTPFLLTVFFFIWINNLMGLIPGSANVMGNIAVTLTLSVFTLIIVNFSGNKNYWSHIIAMPGVPVFVLPILTFVELLGIITKPFALMIRLFANISAGHIIILSIVSLIFIFGEMSPTAGWGSSLLSVGFGLFMNCMELLVALLQAYVFTLLTSVFISQAVEEPHHH